MTAPVVFLDFDGVLVTFEDASEIYRRGVRLDMGPFGVAIFALQSVHERVARVQRICDATGAVVVLSTSWANRHEDLAECRHYLKSAGLTAPVVDRTPRGPNPYGPYRGAEIALWLDRNPHAAYVVLDDDPRAGVGHETRFVCTDLHLTDEDADRAIAMLRGEG